MTVTGTGLGALIDKLDVRPGAGVLKAATLEADNATPTGTAGTTYASDTWPGILLRSA